MTKALAVEGLKMSRPSWSGTEWYSRYEEHGIGGLFQDKRHKAPKQMTPGPARRASSSTRRARAARRQVPGLLARHQRAHRKVLARVPAARARVRDGDQRPRGPPAHHRGGVGRARVRLDGALVRHQPLGAVHGGHPRGGHRGRYYELSITLISGF